MIVTVTANPMVEHVFPGTLTPGRGHRPPRHLAFATGKGLNVARALHSLGEEVVAVAALGGERGREIQRLLQGESIPCRAVEVAGESRVGFLAYGESQTTTLYGPGPPLDDDAVDALVTAVKELLPVRLLVLAGSVGSDTLYPRLCGLGAPLFLDFKHPSLVECLSAGQVEVAKPNRQECRLLFGEDDTVAAAHRLGSSGARWAVVTDEAGPAIFHHQGETWRVRPPRVVAAHAVGCGDALGAGLIHALHRDPPEAVAFAMACGAHNAARPEIGRLDRGACETLASRITLERLDN